MPNFSCVLYVLKVNNRVQVHEDSVHFKKVREAPGWGSATAPAPAGTGSTGAPNPRQDSGVMLMPMLPAGEETHGGGRPVPETQNKRRGIQVCLRATEQLRSASAPEPCQEVV